MNAAAVFSCLAFLVLFLLLLIVPAAILESRWTRKWVRRLHNLELGRRRQEADHVAGATFNQWRGRP